MELAVRMQAITKTFGSKATPVKANTNVDLDVYRGEILSLLGENGSGKTTLMNMLAGIYYPDSGKILIRGREVSIRSPHDAQENGIGMVHQHFKLVDVLTAAENIALGTDESMAVRVRRAWNRHGISAKEAACRERAPFGKRFDFLFRTAIYLGEEPESDTRFDLARVEKRMREICDRYGFDLDPRQKVYRMSVSQKQTLEIVKVLYKGADILILDEPTAVLTPQETEKLFRVMRRMKEDGKSIIIITHKLHEVLSVSDRVAILRKGEMVGSVPTSEATEQSLTELMVGRKISLNIQREEPVNPQKRLKISHLSVKRPDGVMALDDVNFEAYSGEILGIAGISGCGQKELLESVAGLQKTEQGSEILYTSPDGKEQNLVGKDPMSIRKLGVSLSFVPEDRLGMGLVGSMGMTGNMMLRSYNKGFLPVVDEGAPKKLAKQVMEELEVVTPGISTPVSRLSGGNVQKVLVGREIANAPTVLMTAYAVRGLDINTSYTIYRLLGEQKKKGVAVIYVGEDLDVLLELCDRILVLCGGKVSGIVDGRTVTKEQIGLMMTQIGKPEGKGGDRA